MTVYRNACRPGRDVGTERAFAGNCRCMGMVCPATDRPTGSGLGLQRDIRRKACRRQASPHRVHLFIPQGRNRVFALLQSPTRLFRLRRLRRIYLYAPVAQLDRALDYESRGREFESSRARHYFNGLAEVTAKVSHSIPEKLVTFRSCPVLRVAGGAVHFGDCKLRSAPLFAVLPDHFGCAVSRN